MKFPKKFLQALADEEHDKEVVELIKDEVCSHSRWSVDHSVIFKIVCCTKKLEYGKYYSTHYRVGATEQQCEYAYKYSPAEIECTEVVPKKVEVITYVEVEEENPADKGVPTVESLVVLE